MKCNTELPAVIDERPYLSKINHGLLIEVADVLGRLGITWADDNPRRITLAMGALTDLADALAGPINE